MTNDVFQWILYRFEDIAVLARRTAFTAFGLPVSLFEVWASLFVLSVLFTVVFVSRSVSGGETENLASDSFSGGASERIKKTKLKRSSWSINFRL